MKMDLVKKLDILRKEANFDSEWLGSPDVLKLLNVMTDALTLHDWQTLMALLPLLAFRAYPAVPSSYVHQMSHALRHHRDQENRSFGDILQYFKMEKFEEFCQEATVSSDDDREDLDKTLMRLESIMEVKLSGGTQWSRDDFILRIFQGLFSYIQYIYAKELHSVNQFKQTCFLENSRLDTLLEQSAEIFLDILKNSEWSCDSILDIALQVVGDYHSEGEARATLMRYLMKHPRHAPAFRYAMRYMEGRQEVNSDTVIIILKHLSHLLPCSEETLLLIQKINQNPDLFQLDKAFTKDRKNVEISLEQLGSPPTYQHGKDEEGDYYLILLRREIQKLIKDDDVSLKVTFSRVLDQKDDYSTVESNYFEVAEQKMHELGYGDCKVQSNLYHYRQSVFAKMLMKFISLKQWHRSVRAWGLLAEVLYDLYHTWMRCWNCIQCTKSRCFLVSLISIWWRNDLREISFSEWYKDVENHLLRLHIDTVAFVLTVLNQSQFWESVKMSDYESAKLYKKRFSKDLPYTQNFLSFAKMVSADKKDFRSMLLHDLSVNRTKNIPADKEGNGLSAHINSFKFSIPNLKESVQTAPAQLPAVTEPHNSPFSLRSTSTTDSIPPVESVPPIESIKFKSFTSDKLKERKLNSSTFKADGIIELNDNNIPNDKGGEDSLGSENLFFSQSPVTPTDTADTREQVEELHSTNSLSVSFVDESDENDNMDIMSQVLSILENRDNDMKTTHGGSVDKDSVAGAAIAPPNTTVDSNSNGVTLGSCRGSKPKRSLTSVGYTELLEEEVSKRPKLSRVKKKCVTDDERVEVTDGKFVIPDEKYEQFLAAFFS